MLDKRLTPAEVVQEMKGRDVVGIGGWSLSRKPMAVIRDVARSNLKDLTLVTAGGLDVDLLIGVGKVKKVIFNFVAFDGAEVPPVPPFFRRAREKGTVEDMMLCENMLMAGLKGAAERLPFYPTRTGLGTDLLKAYPEIQTFSAPYSGEKLVAMPSLPTDVALIHVNLADPSGHGVILGNPDF